MATKQKSIEKAAEEQLEQEEATHRGHRLEKLKAGEQKRRENEKRLADLEELSTEATQEAERLASEREQIEEALQEKLEALRGELAKLSELDKRQGWEGMKAQRARDEIGRARAGKEAVLSVEDVRGNRGGMVQTSLAKTVAGWFTESMPEIFDPRSGKKRTTQTLAERDPAKPTAKPTVQPRRGPSPEEKRLSQGQSMLRDIHRRRELMDYGRPVAWAELVPPEEAERLSEVLSEEEIAAMWERLFSSGEGGGGTAIV